jgi:hypothetical protein
MILAIPSLRMGLLISINGRRREVSFIPFRLCKPCLPRYSPSILTCSRRSDLFISYNYLFLAQ